VLISYLLGSIPFSLIIGKLFYKTDVREYGSKNLGGTNTGRVLGKKAGFTVMVLDQLKAVIAISLVTVYMKHFQAELVNVAIYLSSIFIVIGHCYPIFAKFKGGKAVACTFGILFVTNIYVYLITLLIYVILLKCTKYVSFGSITVFFISALLTLIPFFRISPFLNVTFDLYYTLLIFILAIFVVIKHRANIKRLQNKTENKIKWMK
jgi:glycerol-3-phosphate acyltransferase PlsY